MIRTLFSISKNTATIRKIYLLYVMAGNTGRGPDIFGRVDKEDERTALKCHVVYHLTTRLLYGFMLRTVHMLYRQLYSGL